MNIKKILTSILIIGLLFTITAAYAVESITGIGIRLGKDFATLLPGKQKVFVIYVVKNSPAEKAGLTVGTEILKVNNINVKNLPLNKIKSLITGEEGTQVTLLVRNTNGKKENLSITRKQILVKEEKYSEAFNLHWSQVAPNDFEEVYYLEQSSRYSPNLLREIEINNYWYNRKEIFKKGFNACQTYKEANRDACYMNLVNREIAKTDSDRQAEIQEQMARQQATQNFVNTMNQIQRTNL